MTKLLQNRTRRLAGYHKQPRKKPHAAQGLDFGDEYMVISRCGALPSCMHLGDLLLHSCDMVSQLGFDLGGRMRLNVWTSEMNNGLSVDAVLS